MSRFERKDRFYKKAKQEGFVARSAYKLIELNQKYKIFKPSGSYLDLGCAPGGWIQVLEQSKPTPKKIIGVDLLPLKITPGPYTKIIQGDFLTQEIQDEILEIADGKLSVILSDMSANLTGISFKDLDSSLELCQKAHQLSKDLLQNGGNLIMKIFPGPDLGKFKKELKEDFQSVIQTKPDSTRKSSNEIYLVCLRKV